MPSTSSDDRLRTHPEVRFAPPVRRFDLDESTRTLRQEPGAGQHGHRQIALYRHGPSTLALFVFEKGAGLPEHAADGFVTIHVLSGDLRVNANGEEHALPEGTLLTLTPGVPHDVRAEAETRMLLTVCLDESETASERNPNK